MVDTNLGPDSLVSPKALDLNHCRQLTICLEVQICIEMSCACFMPRHYPYSRYLCCAFDIAAVGKTFNVYSHDAAVWSENRTHHLPDDEWMHYVLRYSQYMQLK